LNNVRLLSKTKQFTEHRDMGHAWSSRCLVVEVVVAVVVEEEETCNIEILRNLFF
jgi:hypothetical protein